MIIRHGYLFIYKIISWVPHIIKPPWFLSLNSKIPYINKASFTPSAMQSRIPLLLLMLQMVQSLDMHTCFLMNTMFSCMLFLLCWRPYMVLVPVIVIVAVFIGLLLFLWAAHRANHALYDTLVNMAIHLIILFLWGGVFSVLNPCHTIFSPGLLSRQYIS